MKKLVSLIALMALVLIASSGFNENESTLSVGDKVPKVKVTNHYGDFDSKTGGQYVLLTFWSSSDAQSRIDCNRYSAWFDTNTDTGIRHIAINFDNRPELFSEIVRLDKFDNKVQYNVNGLEAENIRNRFGLKAGYGSVLISPQGRIVAFNPATSQLSSLI